jgi:hypothetical protein
MRLPVEEQVKLGHYQQSTPVAAEAKTDYTSVKNNLLMLIFLTQRK